MQVGSLIMITMQVMACNCVRGFGEQLIRSRWPQGVSFRALKLRATVTKYVGRVGLRGLMDGPEIYLVKGTVLGEQYKIARLVLGCGVWDCTEFYVVCRPGQSRLLLCRAIGAAGDAGETARSLLFLPVQSSKLAWKRRCNRCDRASAYPGTDRGLRVMLAGCSVRVVSWVMSDVVTDSLRSD